MGEWFGTLENLVMQFTALTLDGAFLITPEKREDDRGFFARVFCVEEFNQHTLCTQWQQANVAHNKQRGITRGMHYQHAPDAEVKLVRCTKGSVFDAIVDMRPDSSTFRQWLGVELSEQNQHMLYVPTGFAHGYQVLEDNSDLHYMVSAGYAPESEDGLRWNDPAVGIEWPISSGVLLSEKDKNWSLLD